MDKVTISHFGDQMCSSNVFSGDDMPRYKQKILTLLNRHGALPSAVLSAVILAGCAPQAQINMLERNVSGLQVENQRINRELAAVKKQMGQVLGDTQGQGAGSLRKSYARLNSRLDTLESELMRINGLLEQANYKQEQQEQELARLKEALLAKGTSINTTAPPPVTPPVTTVQQPPAGSQTELPPPKQEEKKDLYQEGLELYRQGKYQDAKRLFRSFIKKNPGSAMAANAHFWIGDCEYKLSRFEEAILEYQKVISRFPKSNKVPDALLKQGFAFARLGDKESARIVLKKLVKKYPGTPQAKAAKKQLKRLG